MAEYYNLAIVPERIRKPKDKPLKFFIITNESSPIAGSMAEAVSIPLLRNICRRSARNIWNGTAAVSVDGQIRLELTQVRLSMESLPPVGLNSSPTEVVWTAETGRKVFASKTGTGMHKGTHLFRKNQL